jgi:Mg/Co/Ni transporter MgtE
LLDPFTKGYLALRPAEAARTLAGLSDRDVKAVFSAMPRQLAARVLQHMAPGAASRCLTQLPVKVGGDILARTPALAAVAALRLMEREHMQPLLAAMPRSSAARLRLRLRFSESVIGAFVDADVITLTPEQRVGDALRLLRRAGQRPGKSIPVLNSQRRLIGIVDLGDLLPARDRSMVQNVMRPPRVALNARATLQTAINQPAWVTQDCLPVVNRDGVFQGVLWHARLMDEERLLTDDADHGELAATRAALADIFWMGVGAVFAGKSAPDGQKQADD